MRHPEQGRNEVFVSNANPNDFRFFCWGVKRMGNIAYDKDGTILPHLRPIFVTKNEIEQLRHKHRAIAYFKRAGHW